MPRMQAHESILPFNRTAQWPVVNTLGKGVNLKKKKKKTGTCQCTISGRGCIEARGWSQVSCCTILYSRGNRGGSLTEPGAILSLPFHTSGLTGPLLLLSTWVLGSQIRFSCLQQAFLPNGASLYPMKVECQRQGLLIFLECVQG